MHPFLKKQWVQITISSIFGVLVLCAVCFFVGDAVRPTISKLVDSTLTVWIYIVGCIFVALGCFLSIKPQEKWQSRLIIALVFGFVSFCGYLLVSDQATRATLMAQQADTDRKNAERKQTDQDQKSAQMQGELDGIKSTIEAIAKGSSDSSKWNAVLARIGSAESRSPVTTTLSTGNLKSRMVQLSHDIMANLYRRGWPQMEGFSKSEFANEPLFDHYPHDGTNAEKDDWSRRCVQYFQSMQLKEVVDIYQECLELHIRDEELETYIKFQSQFGEQSLHHAEQVDQIAIHLRQLADQIPATQP